MGPVSSPSCKRAMSGHLWVLTWGRNRVREEALALIIAAFFCMIDESKRQEGVGREVISAVICRSRVGQRRKGFVSVLCAHSLCLEAIDRVDEE